MTISAHFESEELPSATTDVVRKHCESGDSCMVFGAWGSGKSHAVRKAVNGAIKVEVTHGPLQQAQFVLDVARQLGHEGRGVLEVYAEGCVQEALDKIDAGINQRVLVVDQVDRLDFGITGGDRDSIHTVWRSLGDVLKEWLSDRAKRQPTVLVGSRRWSDPALKPVEHKRLSGWSIKLSQANRYPDWKAFAECVGSRPGGLVLGRALVEFSNADTFKGMVERLEGRDVPDAYDVLGRMLREVLPTEWRTVLAMASVAPGIERDLLRELLEFRYRAALGGLITMGFIELRGGRVYPLSLVEALRLARAEGASAESWLRRVADGLLTRVNHVRTLEPCEAERVFLAHRIFISMGDVANAEQTARLHAAGLIELARQTSASGEFDRASRQYRRITRELLRPDAPSRSERQMWSYARHYEAYNRARAGTALPETVEEAYREAITKWEENALWHKRLLGLLARQERIDDARLTLNTALAKVPKHPRRATMLRILPAYDFLKTGFPSIAIEFVQPALDEMDEIDPDGVSLARILLDLLKEGVEAKALEYDKHSILFWSPRTLTCFETKGGWRANIKHLSLYGRGPTPRAAVDTLSRTLTAEVRRLVGTPSHRLSCTDLSLKGRLLGLIDLANSEVGVAFQSERWLVGALKGDYFHPKHSDIDVVDVPEDILGQHPVDERGGLYLARVRVFRDGYPSGPIEELVPAGSGRRIFELLERAGGRNAGEEHDA